MNRKLFTGLLVAGLSWVAARAAEAVRLDLGGGTVIRFVTPSPVLTGGEPLPPAQFDAEGRATVAGLKLHRTIEKIAGGYRIRLAVTNTRAQAIGLRSLTPLDVSGQENFMVAGTAISSWQVFRLARHKNDIPGPFRPTVRDAAAIDAAADNSGASGSDDPSKGKSDGRRFHSDPGLVVLADGKPAATNLFIGFAGQTEHLNDVTFQLDGPRTALARLAAVAEFDGVTVPPGGTRETHELYLQTGKSCDDLLADHVERIRRLYGSRLADRKNVFCTWYFYGPEIVADDLRRDLAELKRRPIDFDLFLIDYGWSRQIGDWTAEPDRFPQGMKEMADEIKAAGLSAGIWTCPFLIDPAAQVLRQHPNLALRNHAGERVVFKIKGIGSGRMCILDPTAPAAEEFLTELCHRLIGWGFDYLKFDFLRAEVNYPDAAFHDPSVDRAQAYRRAMEMLRRASGDHLIGAWGGLYEANAGIVNINRSGSDVRGHWDPLPKDSAGTSYAVRMRQTFARACYDEKLFTSDQDALQLRRGDRIWRTTRPHLSMGHFTDEEAFSTVVYRFLGGGVVQVSDKLDEVPPDRYELYKAVIPTYAPVARRFKPWTEYLPEYLVSHFAGGAGLPPWAVVSLCNWNGHAARKLSFSPGEIPGLPKAAAYAAFEFRTQKFLGIFKPDEVLALDVPTHGTRVIRLTPLRGDGGYLIGTDLNLSGGMELQQTDGLRATLRPEERKFGARLTFAAWQNGAAHLSVVQLPPEAR